MFILIALLAMTIVVTAVQTPVNKKVVTGYGCPYTLLSVDVDVDAEIRLYDEGCWARTKIVDVDLDLAIEIGAQRLLGFLNADIDLDVDLEIVTEIHPNKVYFVSCYLPSHMQNCSRNNYGSYSRGLVSTEQIPACKKVVKICTGLLASLLHIISGLLNCVLHIVDGLLVYVLGLGLSIVQDVCSVVTHINPGQGHGLLGGLLGRRDLFGSFLEIWLDVDVDINL